MEQKKRHRAGRKPLPADVKKQQKTVWLTPDEVTQLEQLGGSVQEGIRQLLILQFGKEERS